MYQFLKPNGFDAKFRVRGGFLHPEARCCQCRVAVALQPVPLVPVLFFAGESTAR